jgi:hypothetical protein
MHPGLIFSSLPFSPSIFRATHEQPRQVCATLFDAFATCLPSAPEAS